MRTLLLSLALIALASAGAVAQPSQRPNVVMIMMDDLGYGDIVSYGAPDVKTPNIDRLAREGVKLTDFYANHADCSPTRTGFITGRYQQRYGIESPLRALDETRQLLPSDTTLPRLLKKAGYVSGLIGKWHLGTRPEAGPNRHGFDEFWGNAAHWPFQAPDLPEPKRGWTNSIESGTRADYIAMVERADHGIGRILGLLDRLKLTQNTLVIPTSDNGGEWLSRNTPLFHRKGTLWEGGIRVGEQHDLAHSHVALWRELRGLADKWEADVDGEARQRATAAAVRTESPRPGPTEPTAAR